MVRKRSRRSVFSEPSMVRGDDQHLLNGAHSCIDGLQMTNPPRLFTATALLIASALLGMACATKPPPKSTTTTRTETSTTNAVGDSSSTNTKETTTEQRDGSSTVERTETKKTQAPAPH
jgi:hypothetical protein